MSWLPGILIAWGPLFLSPMLKLKNNKEDIRYGEVFLVKSYSKRLSVDICYVSFGYRTNDLQAFHASWVVRPGLLNSPHNKNLSVIGSSG